MRVTRFHRRRPDAGAGCQVQSLPEQASWRSAAARGQWRGEQPRVTRQAIRRCKTITRTCITPSIKRTWRPIRIIMLTHPGVAQQMGRRGYGSPYGSYYQGAAQPLASNPLMATVAPLLGSYPGLQNYLGNYTGNVASGVATALCRGSAYHGRPRTGAGYAERRLRSAALSPWRWRRLRCLRRRQSPWQWDRRTLWALQKRTRPLLRRFDVHRSIGSPG